ncbi:phage terminase large subunit GpA-like protein [Paenibacillus rhizosphaerae]|uniref:Phage terminase large subunit GpA-like protein n=1 Tax=Paenibacillus rhizosphaerae TaxID=297318 RepID=A0A839U2Z8_9BACL|nr:phage terminase large subunit family protein [Paenibacillus rhizosphaerae]MBB3132110.1 phage terminase large subunit GpA-like protein [Paenibacillus rhizosphaerae]
MNASKRRTRILLKDTLRLVAPPKPIKVSEWADENRVLSPEDSAEPGPWRTSRSPFQKEIMDAVTDPEIDAVVMMLGSQLGKTAIQLNVIGYYTGHDPSPIMMVQPDLGVGKDFSNDRLTPMYRDSPQLARLFGKGKSRDSRNTIYYKSFPGGRINIAGSNAPASLASKPIRILLADEIDRFAKSAGTEGDPLNLAIKRTTTFHNRKMIFVSTPTIKGHSKIEKLYEDSTQERLHFMCPSCDHLQTLSWRRIKYEYDEETSQCVEVTHACEKCGAMHEEHEWKRDYANRTKWIAGKKHATTRGFHLSALAATINYTWKMAVKEWIQANKEGKQAIKVFINTVLAETWEEEGQKLEHEILLNRREMYKARVPEGVRYITAAVDTQDTRFEIDVVGWGKGYSSWRIQRHVIVGDLNQQQPWQELDEFLSRTWKDADGRSFRPVRTLIDSGGHFTLKVYKFCKPRQGRNIYALKGEERGDGQETPLLNGVSTNNIVGATVVRVGVSEGKATVFSSLSLEPGKPGSCRFPLPHPDNPDPFVYDEEYFLQLTSEQLVTRYKEGKPYTAWVQTRARNEALDLAVYNRAAIEMINPNFDLPLPEPGSVATGAKRQKRPKKKNVSSSI